MRKATVTKFVSTIKQMTLGRIFCNVVLLLFTISCIFPVIWVFYSSLKTKAEFAQNIVNLPSSPQFGNYIEAIRTSRMVRFMLNSFRTTLISLVLIVGISFVTGYFISRFRFWGRKALYFYYMFGLLVPVHALMVPMYLQFQRLGLNNQWYTLIIPYVAFGLPFALFLVESYIASIPKEMEEAAVIEGCSFSHILFGIILPIAAPVIATITIMQFFACWNEFSFALILISTEELRTVPLGLTYFRAQRDTNYPLLMAAMIISLLPVAVVYFSFSGKIIKGVAAGAVKG
jgi:raffinose/stachyose/melibiose transport system permease protein